MVESSESQAVQKNKKTVTISISLDDHKVFTELAKAQSRSVSQQLRHLVLQSIKTSIPVSRESRLVIEERDAATCDLFEDAFGRGD